MNSLKYILTCALLVSVLSAGAQAKKYDYGVDSVNCVKNLSLFNEFIKQKAYAESLEPWRRCIEICPKSRKGLYTNGAKMFKGLISTLLKLLFLTSDYWMNANLLMKNYQKELEKNVAAYPTILGF